MQIRRVLVKKDKKHIFLKPKKIQNIFKDIFQNKIKKVENNKNLLQNILAQVKKERDYLK